MNFYFEVLQEFNLILGDKENSEQSIKRLQRVGWQLKLGFHEEPQGMVDLIAMRALCDSGWLKEITEEEYEIYSLTHDAVTADLYETSLDDALETEFLRRTDAD